ncbi:YesK family protein [Halalkalibacterium halodurans]|jgi:bacteriorhodopsin|uniref:YesK family protein n=1 Tax=Halalkalibacterium halodurans TaxID=86665 RepID=UPI002E24B061|nr:YesK family protein [Halalkalibacterium halodurans]
MEYFFLVGAVVVVAVYVLASILAKKSPSKKHYVLPGVILTVVSLALAVTMYFTGTDGWSSIGYGILFVFVAVASLLGTILGKKFAF